MVLPNLVNQTSVTYFSDRNQQVDDENLPWMRKSIRGWGNGRMLPLHDADNSVQGLLTALKACSKTRNLRRGKLVHDEAVESGHCFCNVSTANALINMYAKCGSMADARKVFDSMKHPTVVSWNTLLLGYADNGQSNIALDMFTRMKIEGPEPDSVTVVAALKACISLLKGASRWAECKKRGKEIHSFALQNGCNSDIYVQSTLVDMYAKCRSMVDSQAVFDRIKNPDVASWNVLILGYATNGQGDVALDMFTRMRAEDAALNSVTLMAALKACTSLGVKEASRWPDCREKGKELHNIGVERGCLSDVYMQNCFVEFYAKCGSIVDAREVFDRMKQPTVVSWTVLILGYADNGQGRSALDMFTKMRTEGPAPNPITVLAALKACTSLVVKESSRRAECWDIGKKVHNIAVENGSLDVYVKNCLTDMYAKCGSMVDAREMFDSTKHPTVVSWTALIMGYADNRQGHTALELFTRMRARGPTPDFVTYGAVLRACGLVGALDFGRTIHSKLDKGIDLDVVLVSCLVDFYAKCGSLEEARSVFNLHSKTRNLITWTALLSGLSSCGETEAAFVLFSEMLDAGVQPNGVTFLCILACCCHAGLVLKGKECFDAMSTKYGVIPTLEHYTCMIDLFGRVNKLDDAMALLKSMPCSPDDVTWTVILDACRKWNNVKIGRLAFQSLIDLNHKDAAAYVLMAQIYGSRGMLQEQCTMMGIRKKWKAHEKSGETCWTNEAGDVHRFLVEDNKHPQIQEIREKWESMGLVMRQHGYTPNLLSITEDITNVENDEGLCGHTEKLALVCALINTQPGKTLRIVKDLRVCNDCHTAIALISKIESRSIICREASRIHAFKDGKCSCKEKTCWID